MEDLWNCRLERLMQLQAELETDGSLQKDVHAADSGHLGES